jgi:NADPH:quinone reductase-like Zn-dependent oxidoreductase
MKAVLCTRYGPPEVLQLTDIEKPAPGPNDVLIKIQVATVTMGDCELRNLTLPLWIRVPIRLIFGYGKPRRFIPGMEFSGVVESVGKDVTNFKQGDAVFGSGGMKMGAYAEYICRPGSSVLAIKPPPLNFQDVAPLLVGGINALHFLRKANIQARQKVLVIGGGGSIGVFGVQLAKFYGAEVTAVDATHKLEMLRSIGADHVIDYSKEDFAKRGIKYDVIFDLVYKSSFSRCIRLLKDDGCYLMANTGPRRMLWGLWVSWTSRMRIFFSFARENVKDLNYLAGLIVSGDLKPVIDKTFPIEQVVEAHRYVEKGNKKGNVILTLT